jgi:hypothetical protein
MAARRNSLATRFHADHWIPFNEARVTRRLFESCRANAQEVLSESDRNGSATRRGDDGGSFRFAWSMDGWLWWISLRRYRSRSSDRTLPRKSWRNCLLVSRLPFPFSKFILCSSRIKGSYAFNTRSVRICRYPTMLSNRNCFLNWLFFPSQSRRTCKA